MGAGDENTSKVQTRTLLRNGFIKAIRFLYLACLTVWSCAVFCLILRKALSHETYMRAVKTLVFIDFSKFYVAGLLAWSPAKAKLYDLATQMLWINNILGPLDSNPDSIPYSPMFCVLMRVFTWMPIETALLLALGTLFGAAAIVITKILRNKGHLTNSECILFWILAMTPVSVVEIFQLGQSTFLWLATMAAFYGCFIRKKDILSGIAIALLGIKPHYAILASAAIFGCKRWKILLAATITELILIVTATAFLGVDTMISYPKFLQWAELNTTSFIPNHIPSFGMITLRGLLAPFLFERLNYQICTVIGLAVWIPLVFVWSKCNKIGSEALSWAAALTVACTLFFSTHSLMYDFMMISICWAITLKTGELVGKFESGSNLRRLWSGIFWLIPGFTWLISALHASYYFSARTHAVILLGVICIASANLFRSLKSTTEHAEVDQVA